MLGRAPRLGQRPRPELAHPQLADLQVAGCHGNMTPPPPHRVGSQEEEGLAAAKLAWGRGRGVWWAQQFQKTFKHL